MKKILSASGDGAIKEWDVKNGQCLKTFIGHKNRVISAVYSRDGGKILSASNDYTVKEWDVKNGQCLKTFIGHKSFVTSALYNEDGKKILSVSWDKTIKEWDVESGKCLKTFIGHKDRVRSAKYSVDEKKILSASEDDTIKEWDVETGQCLKTTNGTSEILQNEENPKGTCEKILALGNEIQVISRETNKTIQTFINIPGLLIQGCSFKNLHPDSDLSEESKKLLRQYGAKFE